MDRALQLNRDFRYPDAATMQTDVRHLLDGDAPCFAIAELARDGQREVSTRRLGAGRWSEFGWTEILISAALMAFVALAGVLLFRFGWRMRGISREPYERDRPRIAEATAGAVARTALAP